MNGLGGIFASSGSTIMTDKVSARENRDMDATFECDYDRNPIPLYQAIENEVWIPVLDFFETGTWSSSFLPSLFCTVDPLAPERQARTWVTRYGSGTNVRWSHLPIHGALTFKAPYKIIERLVTLYPASVRCTNDEHMLPLHLAMKHGAADNVVRLLCNYFPDAARQRDVKGRVPYDLIGTTMDRDVILRTFMGQVKKDMQKKHTSEVKSLKAQLSRKETTVIELEETNDDIEEELFSLRQQNNDLMAELESAKRNLQHYMSRQPTIKGQLKELVEKVVQKQAEQRDDAVEAEQRNVMEKAKTNDPKPPSRVSAVRQANGKPPRPKTPKRSLFRFAAPVE